MILTRQRAEPPRARSAFPYDDAVSAGPRHDARVGCSDVGNRRWAGYASAACAFLFAAVSFYWGLGGTFALDTVGREALELSRAGDVGLYVAVWLTGFAKVGGGLLALALVQPWGRRYFQHWMLMLAGWGGAALLVLYGVAQISLQVMVSSGLLTPPDDMDWRGFYGHLFLWNPWFVLWGVLLAITARHYTLDARGRRVPPGAVAP